MSQEMIEERLENSQIRKGFPDLQIKIVKGFFGKTLPSFPEHTIVFLHIDADLYEGYHDALVNLFPKVAKGGIVLFDEYKEFPLIKEYDYGKIEKWPGCTKAVDEYFAERSEQIVYYPEAKKYYVVKQS